MVDDDSTWEELIEEAYACWREDRYGDALQLCDRAALRGPAARYAAAMLRGDILLELGDAAGALSSFDTIAEASVPDAVLDCARGRALFHMARFPEAENALRSALRGDPGLAEASYTLGIIAEILGTGEETELFRRARKLDPERFPTTPRLSVDAFERVVEAVVDTLPERLSQALAGVPILIAETPHPADLARTQPNLPPTAFGAFVGLTTVSEDGYATEQPQKPAILLFKRNLERASSNPEALSRNIQRTLTVEVGQALGVAEEELDDES